MSNSNRRRLLSLCSVVSVRICIRPRKAQNERPREVTAVSASGASAIFEDSSVCIYILQACARVFISVRDSERVSRPVCIRTWNFCARVRDLYVCRERERRGLFFSWPRARRYMPERKRERVERSLSGAAAAAGDVYTYIVCWCEAAIWLVCA